MTRQVRGLGTLVPEDIRWIPANTEGSVEKILIWPGTKVEPGDVILELTSPELEQSAHDAESKATAAEAELTTMRATLQRELLEQESKTTYGALRIRAGENGTPNERSVGKERSRRRSRLQNFED
jgi:HlyD family secretion protein